MKCLCLLTCVTLILVCSQSSFAASNSEGVFEETNPCIKIGKCQTTDEGLAAYLDRIKWKPPSSGVVPDEKTAVKLAETILIPLYGEVVVSEQRPYKATLLNGVWTVSPVFSEEKMRDGSMMLGGALYVRASQRTGEILTIVQGQ